MHESKGKETLRSRMSHVEKISYLSSSDMRPRRIMVLNSRYCSIVRTSTYRIWGPAKLCDLDRLLEADSQLQSLCIRAASSITGEVGTCQLVWKSDSLVQGHVEICRLEMTLKTVGRLLSQFHGDGRQVW